MFFFYLEEQTQPRYQVSMLEFYIQAKTPGQSWSSMEKSQPSSSKFIVE